MGHKYRHYSDGEYVYFVTWAVVDWIPLFLAFRYFTIMIDALGYCRAKKGLLVHAYVIMPNHIHLIASSEPATRLPEIIRDLKRYTSRELTHALEDDAAHAVLRRLREAVVHDGRNNEYRVWQEGYHPEAIYTQKFFRQKLDYLHENPVRKGYVRRAEDWQFSSACNYITEHAGVLAVDRLAL